MSVEQQVIYTATSLRNLAHALDHGQVTRMKVIAGLLREHAEDLEKSLTPSKEGE